MKELERKDFLGGLLIHLCLVPLSRVLQILVIKVLRHNNDELVSELRRCQVLVTAWYHVILQIRRWLFYIRNFGSMFRREWYEIYDNATIQA